MMGQQIINHSCSPRITILVSCSFVLGWRSDISLLCGSCSCDLAAAIWCYTSSIWVRELCQGIHIHSNNYITRPLTRKYIILLYRQECFIEKYTTRKIHRKLHLGPKWRIFRIHTSEDIDDVISHSFTAIRCTQLVKNGKR